jgi:beta-glucosidase-like glycosyl hydrolase
LISCRIDFQVICTVFHRESYHLDGFVISDCGAIDDLIYGHNYTSTIPETIAVALHAGTDLECGTFYADHMQEALDNKTIVVADIDKALKRTFNIQLRLGYFDPPEQQPYRQITKLAVDTAEALESAEESIVLLKNLNKALPLNIDQLQNKKIALIGPTANATGLMQGSYYGKAPYLIDPVTAFKGLTEGN